MDRKNIITLAAAGAIILAGAGTAAGVTAHNYNVAKQAAEQEGLTAITVDYTQPVPNVDTGTTVPDTTAPVTTQAPTREESSSKSTTAQKTTTESTTILTWVYDAKLSQEITDLLVEKCPNIVKAMPLKEGRVLGSALPDGKSVEYDRIISDYSGSDIAEQIVNDWAPYISKGDANMVSASAYIVSDGRYAIFINPGKASVKK